MTPESAEGKGLPTLSIGVAFKSTVQAALRHANASGAAPRQEFEQSAAYTKGELLVTPENNANSLDKPCPTAMTAGDWTIVAVLLLLLAATLVVAVIGWSSGSGADVPASGYVALALGVVFSLAVGIGLMGLVFYSSRRGYDEPPTLLPAKTPDDN